MHLHGGALDINMEMYKFFMWANLLSLNFAECIIATQQLQVDFLV